MVEILVMKVPPCAASNGGRGFCYVLDYFWPAVAEL